MLAGEDAQAPTGIICLCGGWHAAIRPVQPADAALVQQFVRGLSPLARRRRFFGASAELSPAQLERMTRLDPPRALGLAAIEAGATAARMVGIAQYALSGPASAEVAVVVADDWQRRGLGESLLVALLAHAARGGVASAHGLVLAENLPMLMLAVKLGFSVADDADPRMLHIEKQLAPWLDARPRPVCA